MTHNEIKCTGFKTIFGHDIFDGDLVEAEVKTDRGIEVITDQVHWLGDAWRFGTFDGVLSDYPVLAVKGNVRDTIWPQQRPVI